MKKVIILLFVSALILLTLLSCNKNVDGSNDTTAPVSDIPVDTTNVSDVEIKLFENGATSYAIIRPETSADNLVSAAADFKKAIDNVTGLKYKIESDWIKGLGKDEYVENDNYEILLGATNRKESADVRATLKEREYTVKIVGKKLVIIGYDDYASAEAANAFIEKYLKQKSDVLKIESDVDINGIASVQKYGLQAGAEIRVMSFNTLGTGTLGTNTTYAIRKNYMINTVLSYLPDIVGFQEANAKVNNEVVRSKDLKEYYNINKQYHSDNSTYNYTPIIYLKDKYEQLEGGVEWLNSRYTGTNTKSLSWVVLKRISDGKQFMVINMHGGLWSESYTPPAGETHESMFAKAAVQWKVDNIDQMVAKINEIKAKYGDIPVITTGDYNFNNSNQAYKNMVAYGYASSEDSATVKASKGSSMHKEGAGPGGGSPIDHVFYSADKVQALVYYICVRADDLKASDHCAVYADLKFLN